jgi:hypothetical protein
VTSCAWLENGMTRNGHEAFVFCSFLDDISHAGTFGIFITRRGIELESRGETIGPLGLC